MSTSTIIISINIFLVVLLAVGIAPILIWWERRVAGFIQDRTGPNRCNIGGIRLGGLIQSLADMLKLFFKEDFLPSHIKYKFFFTLAPILVFFCSFLTFAVIPFANDIIIDGKSYMMQAIPTKLGILWFLAFAGITVYGIILGGYASANKYALLGSIRASAQVVSYEAAMGLSIISMVITYGSIHLNDMVIYQDSLIFGFIPAWGIIIQPIAAIIFIITAFAEANRAPFDIAEGESEIVAGYHTEYSAMRFGLFQVGEYAAMSALSAIIVTILLGGYTIPFIPQDTIQSNIYIVLFIVAIIVPIKAFFLTKWIKRNNNWIDKNDPRSKETKKLVKFFWITSILISSLLILLFIIGLSTNGINILTAIIQITVFLIKFFLVTLFFIWIRWTLLRFRYDQLQMLGWKILLPLSILNIFITSLIVVIKGL
jgi:NADH-quinone oxidoreductase subunit H